MVHSIEQQVQFLRRLLPDGFQFEVIRTLYQSAYSGESIENLERSLAAFDELFCLISTCLDRIIRRRSLMDDLRSILAANGHVLLIMGMIWSPQTAADSVFEALDLSPTQPHHSSAVQAWKDVCSLMRREPLSHRNLCVIEPIIRLDGTERVTPQITRIAAQHLQDEIQDSICFVEGCTTLCVSSHTRTSLHSIKDEPTAKRGKLRPECVRDGFTK